MFGITYRSYHMIIVCRFWCIKWLLVIGLVVAFFFIPDGSNYAFSQGLCHPLPPPQHTDSQHFLPLQLCWVLVLRDPSSLFWLKWFYWSTLPTPGLRLGKSFCHQSIWQQPHMYTHSALVHFFYRIGYAEENDIAATCKLEELNLPTYARSWEGTYRTDIGTFYYSKVSDKSRNT